MKIWCSCLLILSGAVLSGCVMSGYEEAASRHRAYTNGQTHATAAEWRRLISDFQEVIDTDAQGPSADDAQYAIASSWVWSIKAGATEAPQQAIEAFQKLIRNYPKSRYVPQAHYWLGRCYAYIGDDYQAITQYQIVESRYAGSEISDPAQLELARVYLRQGYVTRAETLYGNLINSSTDRKIVAAATTELRPLKTQPFKIQRSPVVSPPERVVQAQKRSEPNRKPISPIKPQPKLTSPIKPQPKPTSPTPGPKKPLVPESLTREFGLTAKTIVIDPGHGGKDPGALGKGTLQEKAIVLSISERLRRLLTQKGYTVLMTRDTNRYIPLKERTAFATQHKADLFLSIHANASVNRKAKGIETYYLSVTSTDKASEAIAARENADSGYSIQELETLLKGIIQESKSEDSKRLARHVQQSLVQATGAIDRGVKHARFVVLIGTNVPAILIETGFVSNPTEGHKLTTRAYQHKIATAIAQGIDMFLGKTEGMPLVKSGNPKIAATNAEKNR
ncbi:N-acetylmuramoyl-L-alanine amidase [Candidatus Poribacteria bacterium]|nr:N-acetylmuramoyl-L-alanine amidase [Candidatus Poribacteria bacterium]